MSSQRLPTVTTSCSGVEMASTEDPQCKDEIPARTSNEKLEPDTPITPEISPRDEDLESLHVKHQTESRLGESSEANSPRFAFSEEAPQDQEDEEPGFVTNYWRKYRRFRNLALWLLVTA